MVDSVKSKISSAIGAGAVRVRQQISEHTVPEYNLFGQEQNAKSSLFVNEGEGAQGFVEDEPILYKKSKKQTPNNITQSKNASSPISISKNLYDYSIGWIGQKDEVKIPKKYEKHYDNSLLVQKDSRAGIKDIKKIDGIYRDNLNAGKVFLGTVDVFSKITGAFFTFLGSPLGFIGKLIDRALQSPKNTNENESTAKKEKYNYKYMAHAPTTFIGVALGGAVGVVVGAVVASAWWIVLNLIEGPQRLFRWVFSNQVTTATDGRGSYIVVNGSNSSNNSTQANISNSSEPVINSSNNSASSGSIITSPLASNKDRSKMEITDLDSTSSSEKIGEVESDEENETQEQKVKIETALQVKNEMKFINNYEIDTIQLSPEMELFFQKIKDEHQSNQKITTKREEFLIELAKRIRNFEAPKNKPIYLVEEKDPEFKVENKKRITMEELLGKSLVKLYKEALTEEDSSTEFLVAVAKCGFKHYENMNLAHKFHLILAGASGVGKSFNGDKIAEYIANHPELFSFLNSVQGKPIKDFVKIDGGVVRENSQIQGIVKQFAFAFGYSGVEDIHKMSKFSAKDEIKKIAEMSQSKVHIQEPLTFVSESVDEFARYIKRQESLFTENITNESKQTIFAFVHGNQKQTRSNQKNRAWNKGSPLQPSEIKLNSRNLKLKESKKDGNTFAVGVTASNIFKKYYAQVSIEHQIPSICIDYQSEQNPQVAYTMAFIYLRVLEKYNNDKNKNPNDIKILPPNIPKFVVNNGEWVNFKYLVDDLKKEMHRLFSINIDSAQFAPKEELPEEYQCFYDEYILKKESTNNFAIFKKILNDIKMNATKKVSELTSTSSSDEEDLKSTDSFNGN